MKKLFFFALMNSVLVFAHAQAYWQQQVDFKIEASLDDQKHVIKGFETVDYTNNSPDGLYFIWFHLYPNAYKNDSTAFARQLLAEKDGKDRLKAITDRGFIDSLNFTANGQRLKTE